MNLLKYMLKQLEKEAEEDEEIYDQLACLSAASSRFNTEIRNFDKEVAENQAALGSAIAIRQKELAKFNAEEKDLLLSMDSFVELWLCCR